MRIIVLFCGRTLGFWLFGFYSQGIGKGYGSYGSNGFAKWLYEVVID